MTESNNEQRISQNWQCDDILLGYTKSVYKEFGSFGTSNDSEYVRLHFDLKGNYEFTYKQLNQSFDLIGEHHNIMYSNGFEIEVQNKTLVIETFGIAFTKEKFLHFTHGANDNIKRFSENIVEGKSDLLSQSWGVLDFNIEQVIQQIITCNFGNTM